MNKKILIIAPHADDEIIGVGGTISRRIAEEDEVFICIVTRGVAPLFSDEFIQKLRSETLDCHQSLGVKQTIFLEFPSVMLEKVNRYEINEKVSNVIQQILPDEVYIPHWGDMQKDHQIVAEACMVALRPKYEHTVAKIFAYETLSETGWNAPNTQNEFIPNVYYDIGDYLDCKLRAIQVYRSQLADFPAARSLGAIEALAKYRGATMNLRAAEAFMLIRAID